MLRFFVHCFSTSRYVTPTSPTECVGEGHISVWFSFGIGSIRCAFLSASWRLQWHSSSILFGYNCSLPAVLCMTLILCGPCEQCMTILRFLFYGDEGGGVLNLETAELRCATRAQHPSFEREDVLGAGATYPLCIHFMK